MTSSPKGFCRYAIPHGIEETLKQYEKNCLQLSELNDLFQNARHDFQQSHRGFAKNIKETMNNTLHTIDEVQTLIANAKFHNSENFFIRLVREPTLSGLQPNDFMISLQKMKDNDDRVRTDISKLKGIIEGQPTYAPGRSSFDLFHPLIPTTTSTIPFTEPYDEDLCAFETINCQVQFLYESQLGKHGSQ